MADGRAERERGQAVRSREARQGWRRGRLSLKKWMWDVVVAVKDGGGSFLPRRVHLHAAANRQLSAAHPSILDSMPMPIPMPIPMQPVPVLLLQP